MMRLAAVAERVRRGAGETPRPAGRARLVTAAAIVLVVVQLVWRGGLLDQAYFFGDDLTLTGRASDPGPLLDYLTNLYAVHVMPVGLAVVRVVTALDAYNWTLAAASLLIMQAGASLAVYRMLSVVFGRRPAILLPLAFYLFTPLTVPAFHWWAAGIQAVPFQIAIAMSVATHVTYLRDRRLPDALKTGGWLLLGLGSFHVKAVVALPLLLLLITVLYFSGGRPLRVLRANLPVFAWGIGLVLAYSAIFLAQLGELTQSAKIPTGAQVGSFAGELLGITFPTLAIGGPGEWFSVMAAPATAVLVLAWTVIIGLVLVTLYVRRGAWRAWLIMVLYLPLVDLAPVILGRGEVLTLAREVRYLADSAPVLALCLGLATLPLAGEAAPYRRRLPGLRVVSGVLIVAVVAFSAVSAQRYVSGLAAERVEIKEFLAAARSTLARTPESTDVYPQRLPQDVLVFGVVDEDLSSRTLSPLAPPGLAALMRHPRPSTRPMVLNARGTGLVPADVVGGFAVPKNATGCFVSDGGVIDVPMPHRDGSDVLRLTYTADLATAALVHDGDGETEITFEQGTGKIYVPMTGAAKSLRIEVLSPEAKVCVTAAVMGWMVPA
ncbi:hypothetical protein [Streptosporangium sp. KLBMP 9127]|nr:hypothetical protein [Streptosporangium sp. KLBMP 9127]